MVSDNARSLFERYRPHSLDDVIGQEKAVKVVRRLAATNALGGRAIWISGHSGTGKTSLARIIAGLVAAPLNVQEIDAGKLTTSALRELDETSHYCGLGDRNGRAFIVNEAHGLRKPITRELLTMLEPVPDHVVWIFTDTIDGQETLFDGIDAGPLLSRCLPLALARTGLSKPFAEYAQRIAQAEGLDGKPIRAYIRLAQTYRNNLRRMLEHIEVGDMIG